MKPEQIHEALNLLEDDLVEATDALRNKTDLHGKTFLKRSFPNNKDKKKRPWIKYMSIAACFCIVIVGVYAWGRHEGIFLNGIVSDGEAGTSANENTEFSDGKSGIDTLDGDVKLLDGDTDKFDGTTDGSIAVGEVPSVLVRIDAWQENGFKGVIAGIADTDIFEIGTEISVSFKENISVGIPVTNGMQFEKGAPDEEDFPVGSVVRVQFTGNELIKDSSDSSGNDKYVIYAELVAPWENEER